MLALTALFRGGSPGHSFNYDPALPQTQLMGAWWGHLVPCSLAS